MEKGTGRQLPHDVLEHFRFRAIRLRKKGWKVDAIADAFGVNRRAVTRWLAQYRMGGNKALRSKKAVGPSFTLTVEEMTSLLTFFEDDAMKHGFESPLWTCKRIQQVIQKRFGKKLHPTSILRWLKRWNYTNQKPQRRASQRDEHAIQKWLLEEWPIIRAHVRRWQAMLYFQDECGVSLTAVLGKTWAPKGKTPVAKVTGKRGSICVTSAISPAQKMVFRIEKGKVNAAKHIEFLEQLLKQHPHRKLVIIEDRLPAHRAKMVQQFVNINKKRLAVYYLPPYAPELNPDEHVWAYLKAHQLQSHQAQETEDLKKLVKRKMQSIQRKKDLLHSFFVGTYVL